MDRAEPFLPLFSPDTLRHGFYDGSHRIGQPGEKSMYKTASRFMQRNCYHRSQGGIVVEESRSFIHEVIRKAAPWPGIFGRNCKDGAMALAFRRVGIDYQGS